MSTLVSAQSRPTHDAIEAIIHHATSSRQDQRPLRDTRTQLFVGNLPYRVRWQDLKDLFRQAGSVVRADVSLAPDNRSRGHGTVVLATAEDAGRAVDMFNGYTWQTRVLEVRLDRLLLDSEDVLSTTSPQYNPHIPSAYPAMGGRSGPSWPSQDHPLDFLHSSGSTANVLNFQSPDPNANRTLFVGNLPFHIQWQDLKDLFRKAGTILRADVALGPDNRSRGFGTVVFATDLDAERAIKLFNGYEQNGRILKVHYDKFSPVQQSTPFTSSPFPPPPFLTASSLGQHPASASVSRHSSAASSVVHSAASSPRPGQAYEHPQLSSSLPSHLHTSLHALTRGGNLPSLSALHRRPSQIQLQPHGHSPQIQQNIAGAASRPPGFLYDYAASSRPSTPLKVMQVIHQQQRADPDDFEGVYGDAQQHQHQHQHLGYDKQIQQHKMERLDAQLRERDAQWEMEGLQLHKQQLLKQREEEREWERHRVSHPRRPPQYEGSLAKPASASTPALDIESLTSSLASMRKPSTSAAASATGLSYGLNTTAAAATTTTTQRAAAAGMSITPPSVSASDSVYSASASASVCAPSPTLSNPDSRWTTTTKPPPPLLPPPPPSTAANHPNASSSSVLGTLAPQMVPPSASTASLPLPLHWGNMGDRNTPAGGGGGRKASSSVGVATGGGGGGGGGYDRQYGLHPPPPPPISAHTSTSSSSFGTMESGSGSGSSVVGGGGGGEEFMTEASSPFFLDVQADDASGRAAISGRSSPICDRESEPAGDRQDHHQTAGGGGGSGASSQGGGSGGGGGQQQQRQIPYHPGPISMPPPLTFNPMQIGMMMPLTTMTPGHAPHAQMNTPHAMSAMRMGMGMPVNPNMSPPLYHHHHHHHHPAHAVAFNAMAAHGGGGGGGSPSPFGMYPGPAAAAAALAGAGMLPFTPRGLPTITPSMPAFTFLPQQYFPPFPGPGPGPVPGSGGARAEVSQEHGGGRNEGDAATLEGRRRPSEGSAGPTAGSSHSPRSHSSGGRLQLNAAAAAAAIIPGGLSPSHHHHHHHSHQHHHHHHQYQHQHQHQQHQHQQQQQHHTMSPGTFYGRPGDVPNPFINPAVGAPVHPIIPYPTTTTTTARSPPAVNPAYDVVGVGSPPYGGGYFYGVAGGAGGGGGSSPPPPPPPPPSIPMKGATSSAFPGMEPQGYFDPMYFPAGSIGGAGAGGPVRQSENENENVELSAAEEEGEEVSSPQEEDDAGAAVGETVVDDDEDGDDDDDDDDDDKYGERVPAVPSRTHSDGHQHQHHHHRDTRQPSFATTTTTPVRAMRRRDAATATATATATTAATTKGEHFGASLQRSESDPAC